MRPSRRSGSPASRRASSSVSSRTAGPAASSRSPAMASEPSPLRARPATRWIAAAAAAGAASSACSPDTWRTTCPGRPAFQPSASCVPSMARSRRRCAPSPTTFSEDEFLGQIEMASDSPGPATALRAAARRDAARLGSEIVFTPRLAIVSLIASSVWTCNLQFRSQESIGRRQRRRRGLQVADCHCRVKSSMSQSPLIFRKGLDLKHEVAHVLAESYHSDLVTQRQGGRATATRPAASRCTSRASSASATASTARWTTPIRRASGFPIGRSTSPARSSTTRTSTISCAPRASAS